MGMRYEDAENMDVGNIDVENSAEVMLSVLKEYYEARETARYVDTIWDILGIQKELSSPLPEPPALAAVDDASADDDTTGDDAEGSEPYTPMGLPDTPTGSPDAWEPSTPVEVTQELPVRTEAPPPNVIEILDDESEDDEDVMVVDDPEEIATLQSSSKRMRSE